MKVTLNTDGTVGFDVADVAEAVELARRLQNGSAPSVTTPVPLASTGWLPNDEAEQMDQQLEEAISKDMQEILGHRVLFAKDTALPENVVPEDAVVSVSPQAYEAWQWLIAHDSSAGATTSEVAAALGLRLATASARLCGLIKVGLAHRVSPGRYRPGPG